MIPLEYARAKTQIFLQASLYPPNYSQSDSYYRNRWISSLLQHAF